MGIILLNSKLLTPFDNYPIRSAEYTSRLGATVIIVPHPDDEALGCGGLLALLSRAGQPVYSVLVSDGTLSHPHSRLFSPAARRAVREGELRHSLSILGADTSAPLCLRLPDGQVPAEGQPGFDETVGQLRTFLENITPATVLTPWRRDPHPDHRASSQLVHAALTRLLTPPRRLEYVVWAWERAAPTDLPQPADGVRGFRLDIGAVLPQKQRAIQAHRSQVAPGIFTDDADGFLLSPEMLRHFQQPYEVYFEALPDESEPAQ